MSQNPQNLQTPGEANAQQKTNPQQPAQPFEIAVLPLQNTTLFPETVVPLAVGRTRSIAAVEAALKTEEKLLACISARESQSETGAEARPDDLYKVGTLVMIKRMMRTEDVLNLIVQGTERVRVIEWL